MRRLIRWISLAALAVLLLPILHEFAPQHQVYNNPPESVSTFLGYVRSLGDLPHFEHVLAFVGGLTLGIWIYTPSSRELIGPNRRNTQRWPTKQFA